MVIGDLNCKYSWFAINLSGWAKQCQPPTPAESDNAPNNICYCVVPPTWPPRCQMETTNSSNDHGILISSQERRYITPI